MLLTIDIGNTATKFGVFAGATLEKRHIIPTIRGKSAEEIQASLGEELNYNFRGVIVSSVVPELDEAFARLAENFFRATAVFVKNDFDFGLSVKYNPPASVGIDRLIAAFAATEKYGAPCVVCDFGTATNIEVVNSRKEYLGGIITAGLNLLGDSLRQRTSKLPQIEIRKPEKVIGDNTIAAIQSGVYFGYVGLVDGLVNRICEELGENPKVVATGGLASLIAQEAKSLDLIDDNLILDGLRMIYEKRLGDSGE